MKTHDREEILHSLTTCFLKPLLRTLKRKRRSISRVNSQSLHPFPCAGTVFNIGDKYDTQVTGRKIAEAIAERLSLSRVESVSFEEAAKIWNPTLAWFFSITNRYTSELAEKELGWEAPEGRSILKDTVEGGRLEA